ncbi:MAG: hypothetical protein Kow0063_21710 [Anaerolineae bacterium]
MNEPELRQDLFLLLGYLLTSAHGLYAEPAGYGPFRLLDAAGRLLELMDTHELADPFLAQLGEAVRAERFGNSSDEMLREALNQLCLRYALELKKRVG